jgi:hypothetical protein
MYQAAQKKRQQTNTVKIDASSKPKRIEGDPAGTTYRCTCCGKSYTKQSGNFQVSYSPLYKGNNGFLSICRTCEEQHYQQLVGYFSGNERHALERCCQLFDWYYSEDAIAMMEKSAAGRSRVLMYPTKMGIAQIQDKGTTYLDTIKDRTTNKIMGSEDLSVEEDNEENIQVSRETVMFFGFGYTDEEYQYLESEYQSWTTRHECKTKAQEEIFKGLCLAQLTVLRAQQNGTNKEFTDAMKTFQDLLGSAGLKPNQNNDNSMIEQNTFGTLIRKIENERPIADAQPEWLDVDGINRYIDTYFLGHMAKLVHVKNDKAEMYEREIAKHTVQPPKYEGAEDMASATSLLDKYSDKGDKDDE